MPAGPAWAAERRRSARGGRATGENAPVGEGAGRPRPWAGSGGNRGLRGRGGGAVATPARRHHRLAGGEPEQRAHPVEERLALEGLGDVRVRSRGAGARLVEGLEVSGEKQHRRGGGGRIRLQRLADLVAAPAGHQHVGDDQVRAHLSARAMASIRCPPR
jgi:hypothetical protein